MRRFGMIRNVKVERRAPIGIIGQATFEKMLVRCGKQMPRFCLLHELGHFFEPGGKTQAGKSDRFMTILGHPVTREILCEEAAAWRWAVRAWTRRGRRLGQRERNLIRLFYQSYLSRRHLPPPDNSNPTPLSKGGVIRNHPELNWRPCRIKGLRWMTYREVILELTKIMESES
jgi:hypothetical protein